MRLVGCLLMCMIIYEKPNSAIVVLKGLEALALQDESTEALYVVLHTMAEYIATDSIVLDSQIQKALQYYNKNSNNIEIKCFYL